MEKKKKAAETAQRTSGANVQKSIENAQQNTEKKHNLDLPNTGENDAENQYFIELAEMLNEDIADMERSMNKVPESVGMFRVKSAYDTIVEAKDRPDPRPLWKSLWHEGEVCCLFADSNVGKSIYAVQIADYIARSQKVLYFDFEISDKQFQLRYTSSEGELYKFPEGLFRVDIDNESFSTEDLGNTFEDSLIHCIEKTGLETGAKVLIIDNLTWICCNSEKGSDAGQFMMKLMALKKKYGFSILVIAHTPKRSQATPITPNDLAGSKKLYNFFDEAFSIGQSAKDTGLRYIKQLKVRDCAIQYGGDNVIVCSIEQEGPFLQFIEKGLATEREHLKEPSENDAAELKEQVIELRNEGKSIRTIADLLGISKTKVGRIVKDNTGVPSHED